jgi:hypothetical protein
MKYEINFHYVNPVKASFCVALLSGFIVISGCASHAPSLIQREVIISDLDFRKYSKNGFLFTPFEYSGKYESIGIVSATIFPKASCIEITTSANGLGTPIGCQWSIQPVYADDVLATLYTKYSTNGADAIVDLKLSPAVKTLNEGTIKAIRLNGITMTGFAIKRSE